MRALLAILLLAAGCVDALDLWRLRSGLTREFHEEAIAVSLTDGLVLTVTFVSSSPAASRLPFRFSRIALQRGQLSADSASPMALCPLDADPESATP